MMGRVASRLGANLHVKGEIRGSEDLVIEGTFEGLVQLDQGKLTIETTARVTADIVAAEVVVCGNLKGNARAKDRIEIKKDASVTGDLTTPQISKTARTSKDPSTLLRALKRAPTRTSSTTVAAKAAGAGPNTT